MNKKDSVIIIDYNGDVALELYARFEKEQKKEKQRNNKHCR